MKKKSEIVKGRNKMIITRKASGIDKVKEAILIVMGDKYEFEKNGK